MLSSLIIISCALTAVVLAKETSSEVSLSEAKKAGAATFYDQRQTGKYNVHVNIKDVQFFSVSDSLGSIGGDYEYGDYGSYDNLPETDSDYDASHLTVNPIFAFLGSSQKPTTVKPVTTSAAPEKSTEASTDKGESSTTVEAAPTSIKQELETTVKQESEATQTVAAAATTTMAPIKPALKPLKVNDSIEYEEIPVEVQYYRANHPKLPMATSSLHRNEGHFKRYRPSVQILDGRNNNHNVKIIESGHMQHPATIKICGRGEFRDARGRCRLKAHARNRVPGL
jgi:hypothetical protein